MHTFQQIPKSTIDDILRKNLKWKPFKYMSVQKLEQTHIDQRKVFCEWLLQQPDDFADRVLWSDEKWWMLQQPNNKQNDRIWKAVNPREIRPNRVQGDLKASILAQGRLNIHPALVLALGSRSVKPAWL